MQHGRLLVHILCRCTCHFGQRSARTIPFNPPVMFLLHIPLTAVPCSCSGTRINSFLLLRNENTKIHRTEAYRTPQVVLRRGFDFLAQFQLATEFNPDEHSLEVHFRRGPRPAYSRATHFVSRIGRKPSRSYHWPGSTLKTNREVVTVAVQTPVDVPVGEYEVEAEVEHEEVTNKFTCQETVVFLFNPWHEGVCVCMCLA